MHYLYIIYSEQIDRFYVGESTDPKHRLGQHNSHYFPQNFTKAANDWKLKLSFQTTSRENALYLEKFIKRMKSRSFIEKILANPKILQDLLEKR